ncbi:hypothetical protein TNCV_1214761 [Trichonephila clavipes]|nr:hypothetical protein TNCV_1214761 [Trichonephila clavipes]
MTEKSEECSSNQPVANLDQPVVLQENSITVRITEPYKQMDVMTQQLYVSNSIEGGWYTHQKSQCLEKPLQTTIEPPCPCTVPT